nr:hypothetical protein [Tanacetum cinerariifolium]
MVLYLVPDYVLTVPTVPIPAPHWDDVIVISSDEEYSKPEMPPKKVSVKSRKRVFALVDESDSDDDSAESPEKAIATAELPESAAAYAELLV